MPTLLSVSPGLVTPYSQWGSDIAEFSSSGPPSAAVNAKGTAELYRPTHLSSATSYLPSSAYIAAYLFASPRVVNHSILPIGMKPATGPKPHPSSTSSPTSPARDALGMSSDILKGAPSLQPGTAKEERERRMQTASHHRKAELPEVLRRVDASKDSLTAHRPTDGASRLAKEQSNLKNVRQDHGRSSSSPSQTTSRKTETETVRCTITPLDWPQPNSAAFPPLSPSSRALNVEPSRRLRSLDHQEKPQQSQVSPSLTSSASKASSRHASETQDSSLDKHALVSCPPAANVPKKATRRAQEQAVLAERIKANTETLERCIGRLEDMSRDIRGRTYETRGEMHQRWLREGTISLSDVERVTLKGSVSDLPKAPAVAARTADSKVQDETSALSTGSTVEEGGLSTVPPKAGSASGALPKSKSSRSVQQAVTTPAHGGSSEGSTRRPLHAKDVGLVASVRAESAIALKDIDPLYEQNDRPSSSAASDSTSAASDSTRSGSDVSTIKASAVATRTAGSKLQDKTGALSTGSTVEKNGLNTVLPKAGSASGALPKSKSSRSVQQAIATPAHGGSSPPTEGSTRRTPHAKEVGLVVSNDRPPSSAASDSTRSGSDVSTIKASQPYASVSVHSAGSTDRARKKAETTAVGSEGALGTSKSASSSRPRGSAASSSEGQSLEKSRSSAARPVPDIARRDGTSAALREKASQRDASQEGGAKSRYPGQDGEAGAISVYCVIPQHKYIFMTYLRFMKVETVRPSPSASSKVTRAPSTTAPNVTAPPLKPLPDSPEAPKVRWKPTTPLKIEKPKSLAAFAEVSKPGLPQDHTDLRNLDALTPLATFFAESVVSDDGDSDANFEDSPFGRQTHLPFVPAASGPDVWKSASLTEVNVMKPHFSQSLPRNSLAGLVVAGTNDQVDTGARSGGEGLPRPSGNSRDTSTAVRVLAQPIASGSTVSTTDHVMRTDPGPTPPGPSQARVPFLLRAFRRPEPPPPRYSSVVPPVRRSAVVREHQVVAKMLREVDEEQRLREQAQQGNLCAKYRLAAMDREWELLHGAPPPPPPPPPRG
ncbi:hypothetical protein OH76DRAFT_1418022 [Lentinus brumalis]|uniref:Uncharacterized protein n=1 Tax=Lentinus brumalis TaxID=2498619 RepID=A0A371DBW7_9APHY|nr:hypothetical protein OH76DRAFT_1418022 [Polyporus brumalis]